MQITFFESVFYFSYTEKNELSVITRPPLEIKHVQLYDVTVIIYKSFAYM